MSSLPSVRVLARRFSGVIRSWLTPEEIREANRRNQTPEYKGACASHDFCDANQAMLDALASLGISEDFVFEAGPRRDTIDVLVDKAWDLAKQKGFQPRKI